MSSGWALPGQARKFHAFREGDATSVCGHWWLPGVLRDGFRFDAPLDAAPSKSDCTPCARGLGR